MSVADDYDIIVTPEKKWIRLALLLQSETLDKLMNEQEIKLLQATNPCNYSVISDKMDGDIFFDEIEKDILWAKDMIKKGWIAFVDNL